MKDYRASMEKLRRDAADNRRVADLATDMAKRAMFGTLARHLDALADEVERAMNEQEKGADSSAPHGVHSPGTG